MPIVTVFEKLYGSGTPEILDNFFFSMVMGLKVQLNFIGVANRGWIQLDVSGDDETAALSLIDQKIGLMVFPNNLRKYQVKRGKIIFSDKRIHELRVDLGVNPHASCDAVLREKTLRGQLADGEEISLQNLVELFCLIDNMPLEVKILEGVGEKQKEVEACLSEDQLSLFRKWVRCRFDRLIVMGSLFSDVEKAVKYSNLSRDVIRIESLGVLEQVVLCKLGTDAVGLIPKIGRYFKSTVLVPFSPKRIIKTIDSHSFES